MHAAFIYNRDHFGRSGLVFIMIENVANWTDKIYCRYSRNYSKKEKRYIANLHLCMFRLSSERNKINYFFAAESVPQLSATISSPLSWLGDAPEAIQAEVEVVEFSINVCKQKPVANERKKNFKILILGELMIQSFHFHSRNVKK